MEHNSLHFIGGLKLSHDELLHAVTAKLTFAIFGEQLRRNVIAKFYLRNVVAKFYLRNIVFN